MKDFMTADAATREAWKAIEKLYALKKLTVDKALCELPRPSLSRDGVQTADIVDFELAVTRLLISQYVRIACESCDETGGRRTAAFYKALYNDVIAVEIRLRWNVLNRYLMHAVRLRKRLRPGWTARYQLELRLLKLRWERELGMWAVPAQAACQTASLPDENELSE
jgi:hypothetical protein